MAEPVIEPNVDVDPVEPTSEAEEARNKAETEQIENMTKQTAASGRIGVMVDFLKNLLIGDTSKAQLKDIEMSNLTSSSAEAAEGLGNMLDALFESLNKNPNYDEGINNFIEKMKTTSDDVFKGKGEAVLKWVKTQAGAGLGNIERGGFGDIIKELNNTLNKNGGMNEHADISDGLKQKDNQLKAVNDRLDELSNDQSELGDNFKKLVKNMKETQNKNDIEKAEKGEPVSSKKWSAKEYLALAAMLLTFTEITVSIIFVLEFCADNSGCFYVVGKKDEAETTKKIICVSPDTDWGPVNCVCSPSPNNKKEDLKPNPTTDTKKECTDGKLLVDAVIPQGHNQCSGDITETDYTYYTYKVMTPLDAVINLGQKILPNPGKWGDEFLNILKWVGIFACIIVVLLIILAVVRHHTENKE